MLESGEKLKFDSDELEDKASDEDEIELLIND